MASIRNDPERAQNLLPTPISTNQPTANAGAGLFLRFNRGSSAASHGITPGRNSSPLVNFMSNLTNQTQNFFTSVSGSGLHLPSLASEPISLQSRAHPPTQTTHTSSQTQRNTNPTHSLFRHEMPPHLYIQDGSSSTRPLPQLPISPRQMPSHSSSSMSLQSTASVRPISASRMNRRRNLGSPAPHIFMPQPMNVLLNVNDERWVRHTPITEAVSLEMPGIQHLYDAAPGREHNSAPPMIPTHASHTAPGGVRVFLMIPPFCQHAVPPPSPHYGGAGDEFPGCMGT